MKHSGRKLSKWKLLVSRVVSKGNFQLVIPWRGRKEAGGNSGKPKRHNPLEILGTEIRLHFRQDGPARHCQLEIGSWGAGNECRASLFWNLARATGTGWNLKGLLASCWLRRKLSRANIVEASAKHSLGRRKLELTWHWPPDHGNLKLESHQVG